MTPDTSCPQCHEQIVPEWYYCAHCGKVLKIKPITVAIPKQLLLYAVSFFLAPLGLAWGIRYLRNPNRRTKLVGVVIVVLTLASLTLTIYSFMVVMREYSRMLMNLGDGVYSPGIFK